MGECTHDCSTCSEKCDSKIEFEKQNEFSNIKKVIAVISGKGGVGKSLVTSLLAVEAAKKDLKVGIIDADITGPSIPKAFGIKGNVDVMDDKHFFPRNTNLGIKVVSSNLLLDDETDPVIWRGPIIAGLVKQFYTDVVWDDIDYMFIDCPPGTGDVPLTIFQSIKLDGIIIVTSPQELVSMIVSKAVKMANMMNIPIYGIVENMSYIKCPDCGKEIDVFGTSKVDEVATDFELKVLGRLPIDPKIAKLVDAGKIEDIKESYLSQAIDAITAK